jgi:NarL family two-component system response regulator LiaR
MITPTRASSPPAHDSTQRVRVAVVSEQALLSHLLHAALVREDAIEVVHEVSGDIRTDKLAELAESKPDVVVLCAVTKQNDGLIRAVGTCLPSARVIVLSGTPDSDLVVRAIDAGAAGYIALRLPFTQVVAAISARQPIKKHDAVAAAVPAQSRQKAPLTPALTKRETDVLRLLASGRSTHEITVDLGVAPATVRTHTQSILSKLGLHSKVEAAAYAVRHELM